MICRSSSPTKRKFVKAVLVGQGGGASPFMYGLILGVTIFSAISMQAAKQQLAEYQAQQLERNKARAQDVANAMDFAILTETRENYDDAYTLERSRQYASTTGKTRGEQDFLVTARENTGQESFGQSGQKIAIAATDDTLVRGQVDQSESAEDLARLKTDDKAVVVYDTSAARDRQIRTSISRMDQLAEQIYAFYASHMRFPNTGEYAELEQQFDLVDVWGEAFDYSVASDQQSATMSFTTPWNYTHTVNLSLKDTP